MDVRDGFRAFLGAVLILGLAGCGASGEDAASGETKTLTFAITDPFYELPAYVAKDQGYLKDGGLDVEFLTFKDPSALTTAVAKGDIDLGLHFPLPALYNSQNDGDFRFLAMSSRASYPMIAKAGVDVPVATGDDWQPTMQALKGRKVGVTAIGGLVDLLFQATATEAGVTPEQTERIAAGGGAAAVTAFQQGLVDVILVSDAAAAKILATVPDSKQVMSVGEQGLDYMSGVVAGAVFASDSHMQKDPEAYASFIDAWTKGVAFINDPNNADKVIRTLQSTSGLDESTAKALYEAGLGFDIEFSEDKVQHSLDAYHKLGIIPDPPSAAEMTYKP